MAEYKKQHTVTRKYLEGFVSDQNNGKFSQYKKSDGTCNWLDPKDATTANYIYSILRPDGTWNHSVEKTLGDIESKAIPIIQLICEGKPLSFEDRYNFSLFAASMFLRPRHAIEYSIANINDFIGDPQNALTFVEENHKWLIDRYGKEEVGALIDRLKKGDWNGYEMGAKVGRFRAWLENLPNLASIMSSMSWELWKSDKYNLFLTSDSPVSTRRNGKWDDSGIVGIAREDLKAEVHFSLNSRNYLLMKHGGSEVHRKATKTRVMALNALTVRMAHRFVYFENNAEHIRSLILSNNQLPAPLPAALAAKRSEIENNR